MKHKLTIGLVKMMKRNFTKKRKKQKIFLINIFGNIKVGGAGNGVDEAEIERGRGRKNVNCLQKADLPSCPFTLVKLPAILLNSSSM